MQGVKCTHTHTCTQNSRIYHGPTHTHTWQAHSGVNAQIHLQSLSACCHAHALTQANLKRRVFKFTHTAALQTDVEAGGGKDADGRMRVCLYVCA